MLGLLRELVQSWKPKHLQSIKKYFNVPQNVPQKQPVRTPQKALGYIGSLTRPEVAGFFMPENWLTMCPKKLKKMVKTSYFGHGKHCLT